MRRPKLTALGRLPPTPPPAHLCACGCGREADHGYPLGRWFVRGHEPTPAAEAAPPPADLFAAAGVRAPTKFRASPPRPAT